MRITEILLEKKTKKKKARKTKAKTMYSNTSFRTPIGGFGGWYYGVPMDTGSGGDGGDGGGGE